MDLSPSASPQMPLKGDIWSQMPPTGDNWMDTTSQMRECRSNRNRVGNRLDRNRRRHTVTELPSSMRNDGAFRTVNQSCHIRNSGEMNTHYGTPLSIKIPDSEMPYGMNLWNSSYGTQVHVGLQQVGQNYSSCPSSLNGTGCRAFSPGKLGMNPLQQPPTQQPLQHRPFHHPQTQQPLQQPQLQRNLPSGWSHVSAFVPTNHWKRPDISKLCQNDRINSIGNIVQSGHQYQNRAASEEKVTRAPEKPPWDQENNENEPRPIVSRKKPVARRRHTLDLVPNQREIAMGYGDSFNSDRFQTTQNLPNPRERERSSFPSQDKITNITQISFDAMLGIISQVANSTNESRQNRTATNAPQSATTASSFPGTSYTNVLRIDEEPSVASNNKMRRQGPYGQEQTSKVHAKPFPGKTPIYSRVRSHGPTHGCFSPGKSQMPTISEDSPIASRKSASNCDRNASFVTAMTGTTTQQMHELYRQNFTQNNQSFEVNTNPEFNSKQSTMGRQRSTRKKKQPTLESMLGVSDDNPTQSNSLSAHQLFNKSSPVARGMSFNERIDSLTKKWMNKQERQHTYEFTNAGTSIVASIPADEVPGNSTQDSLEIRKRFDRDSQVQRLHRKNRLPKMSRLPNEPFSNNSLAATQMPDNKEGVNAAVTNMKNPFGPNEVKSNLRAPKKHIASFTLSGLTPACIYISLPQVR